MMLPIALQSALQTAARPLERLTQRRDAGIAVLPILTVLATVPDNRRTGRPLQIVLPLIALGAAVFTGGSRIETGRHNLWQAMAGLVCGWVIACLPLAGAKASVRKMRKIRGRHV